MTYEANIGLETHVQLRTRSKMFCGCATVAGAEPNTHVCPVCLGYPGAMPTMNGEAIRLTVMTGLAIGSRISEYSTFDRKSYFYPDMPKNYQISQYDKPFCLGGGVTIEIGGVEKRIGVTRIHLEEDVAKNVHFETCSGVDFNRAGFPLMEIVSEPDMGSAEEAFAYLQALKAILQYAGVSHCNLEQGNVRCDVNCSVRPVGRPELGTKTEIKNLNTFRGVLHAIKYEVARQIEVLESGGTIVQETRRWDVDRGVTCSMRTKEDAHDYRYFPEPDLMPVVLSPSTIAAWRAELPELPQARRRRWMEQIGLPAYDAGVLVADRDVADYFEKAAAISGNPKAVSNWVMTEILRWLADGDRTMADLRVTPEALAGLVRLVDQGAVSSSLAKEIFAVMVDQGGDPAAIAKERGLIQVSNEGEIEALVDRAMAENPRSVEDYRAGKTAAAKHLMGQVMRLSRGKANPQLVNRLLERKLTGS